MNVLILAGGKASRMWPIKTNKLLLPFFGEPFISHLVRLLVESRLFGKIFVVSAPEIYDQLAQALADRVRPDQIAIQTEAKGMAGAVLAAAGLIKNDPVLVVNGDDLFEAKLLVEVVEAIRSGNPEALIVGKEVTSYFPGGYLKLDRGFLAEVIEKPKMGQEPSTLIKMVIDYFSAPAEFIAAINQVTSAGDNCYELALTSLVGQGRQIPVLAYQGDWVTLKYPWHILEVMDYLGRSLDYQEIHPSLVRDGRVTLEGPMVISEGVKIFSGATIKGPVFIGPGAVIGTNSLIIGSQIGPGSVIGYDSEVARCWLGQDCWLHANYLGDSVLEENVALGAGAVLANFRLDETEIKSAVKSKLIPSNREKLGGIIGSDVRIGINAALMPGVKIGRGSLVGPGVILGKDLDEGKAVFCKQTQIIKKNQAVLKVENRAKFRKKL